MQTPSSWLEHVGVLAREQGYSIEDIDSVVMLQEPKMSPYREQMRANIAAALRIPVDNVGVKATTTSTWAMKVGERERPPRPSACSHTNSRKLIGVFFLVA